MDQEQVNQEWNAMADDWDDLAGSYAQSFFKTLETKNLFPESSASSDFIILDFGCGTGLLTEKLQDKCNTILAIDASPKMISLLQEKIQSREWTNVAAMHDVIGKPSPAVDSLLDKYGGRVDLIVASSVFNFVPDKDLPTTLQVLARLLTPETGRLCHSDWPKNDTEHPHGMTREKATMLYQQAGLIMVESEILLDFVTEPGRTTPVYIGVAKRDKQDNDSSLPYQSKVSAMI